MCLFRKLDINKAVHFFEEYLLFYRTSHHNHLFDRNMYIAVVIHNCFFSNKLRKSLNNFIVVTNIPEFKYSMSLSYNNDSVE